MSEYCIDHKSDNFARYLSKCPINEQFIVVEQKKGNHVLAETGSQLFWTQLIGFYEVLSVKKPIITHFRCNSLIMIYKKE